MRTTLRPAVVRVLTRYLVILMPHCFTPMGSHEPATSIGETHNCPDDGPMTALMSRLPIGCTYDDAPVRISLQPDETWKNKLSPNQYYVLRMVRRLHSKAYFMLLI